MAYQALYRKYRPLTFDDVVGQEPVTRTLKNAVMSGRIGHAYLFCGTRGTGKTTTARILSRALNCENPQNGNPCNQCPGCLGILNESVLDVTEIDAASNNGVDNIRSLRDDAAYSAASVKYKVYIIDEAHMLSQGAYNALLKVLEEPPPGVVFILATTERVSATILSRCQRFDFKRITPHDIAGRLRYIAEQEGVTADERALSLIADAADGALRDGVSLLDQCIGQGGPVTYESALSLLGRTGDRYIEDIFSAIAAEDDKTAVSQFLQFVREGKPVSGFVDSFVRFARELLFCKLTEDPSEMLSLSEEELSARKALGASFSKDKLLYCIRLITEAGVTAKQISNASMLIEVALIKMCRPALSTSSEGYAVRIAELERKCAQGIPVAAPAEGAATPVAPKKKVMKMITPEQQAELIAKIKKQWQSILKEIRAAGETAIYHAILTSDVMEDDGRLVILFTSKDSEKLAEGLLADGNRKIRISEIITAKLGACPPIILRSQEDYMQEVDADDDVLLAMNKALAQKEQAENTTVEAEEAPPPSDEEAFAADFNDDVPIPEDEPPEEEEYMFEEDTDDYDEE